jgi:prepilin-type N-terminal cleavage/methylation domain-containing protein
MSTERPEVRGGDHGGGYTPNKRANDRARRHGFSLMELMTVVTIVGVLSAIAIPTFSDYIYKSRTSEATEFLGVIRLREESYRSEFGVYCPTLSSSAVPNAAASLATPSNLVPDPSTTRRDPKVFNPTAEWRQLGARPTSWVRFGYGVAAGTPADAVAQNLGWTTANADFWYVARATGDLDADNVYVTFEIYSATKGIWIGGPGGTTNAKGWE